MTTITQKMPRLDRRIQRTRKTLRDSLMALILERGYDAITVQDVTERANMGRATFYLHFRDKEDLLLDSLEDITEEVRLQSASASADAPVDPATLSDTWPTPGPVVFLFRHAAQNRTLYRVMLTSGVAAPVLGLIRGKITESITNILSVRPPEQAASLPNDLAAHYLSGALFELLRWWLETNSAYTPEQMGEYFRIMTWRALGIGDKLPPPPAPKSTKS